MLFQDETGRPTIESVEVFSAQWTGLLILITNRASLVGALAKFDFSWFIPALVKYRKLLGEVLLISFMLQLFGLVSPLFFQVVMDKVLVHKGMTTLDVLVTRLVMVVAFESLLNALRAYVFSHTTSRIDVELERERQTQLTAPVAGVVQQLGIHSVGGVVTSAQPLMVVVPDSPTVTAEVTIANQDIGFVYPGQMAAVKLETFPYTQYGTVPAQVDVVTADAVTDDKKGSHYPATLTLAQRDMLIDGKRVNLSPGMNITAEIKTGQRRIIEFLLSPVQKAGSESLRER